MFRDKNDRKIAGPALTPLLELSTPRPAVDFSTSKLAVESLMDVAVLVAGKTGVFEGLRIRNVSSPVLGDRNRRGVCLSVGREESPIIEETTFFSLTEHVQIRYGPHDVIIESCDNYAVRIRFV